MNIPPRIDYYGDKEKAQALKGEALKFWAFVTHPSATGSVQTNTVPKRFKDGTVFEANYCTTPYGQKTGVLTIFVPPPLSGGGISGFLFYARGADGNFLISPKTGLTQKNLLVTDANGFQSIQKDVRYKAGLSYWTDGETLISWNSRVIDYTSFNISTNVHDYVFAPYNVITKKDNNDFINDGTNFLQDSDVYIDGIAIGLNLRPFDDGDYRNRVVYAAKVKQYLLAIVYTSGDGESYAPNPDAIYSASLIVCNKNYTGISRVFIDKISFKKIHINKKGTKMVCIARILPKTAPSPIGDDITDVLPIVDVDDEVSYALPLHSGEYPGYKAGMSVNYWEAVIHYDIQLTNDNEDPIHLVETSRIEQFGLLAAMKRQGLTPPHTVPELDPDFYNLLAAYENHELITDIWFDVETQEVVYEKITDVSVAGFADYSFNIHHPYLSSVLTQTVSCTATDKTAHGYSLMRNNYYVKNSVVTECDVTASVVTYPSVTGSGTLSASRYDNLDKLTFDSISAKDIGTPLFNIGLYPFLYRLGAILFLSNHDNGRSEYSFPFGCIYEGSEGTTTKIWQFIAPAIHFQRELNSTVAVTIQVLNIHGVLVDQIVHVDMAGTEHVDNSGVLTDRFYNALYFWGEDDYILRTYKSLNQKCAAFTKCNGTDSDKNFVKEKDEKITKIRNAIKFNEDIIGVI